MMDGHKSDLRGNLYNQPFRSHQKKKSIETNQTNQLPTITRSRSNEKTNQVYNQLNSTKSKITEMQARLKNLKNIKEQFELKHKHNLTKIKFINDVKQRATKDQQHKQKVREKRHQSLMQLKAQATDLRESIVRQKKQAYDQLLQKKSNDAELQRRRSKQYEYLRKKLRDIDLEKNKHSASKVRQFQSQTASRMKQFYSSRVSLSKQNYEKKLLNTIREREKASRMFERLQQEEQRMLSEVKQSQKTMLTSLYSLVTINPQKKVRRNSIFRSSEPSEQMDVDNYEKEQFQT